MNYEVKLRKGREGWEADSRVPLDPPRAIKISTGKNMTRGGLTTYATVVKEAPDGSYSFVMFHDYSKTIYQTSARCTQKSVAVQHQLALAKLPEILEEIKAYYANRKEASDGGEPKPA